MKNYIFCQMPFAQRLSGIIALGDKTAETVHKVFVTSSS